MTRTLILASILTLTLGATALAQPAVSSPPPARAPSAAHTVRLSLEIKTGTDVRKHELVISQDGCGSIRDRTSTYTDEVKICSRVVTSGLLVEIDGTTQAGANEYRTRSEGVLARKGAVIEIGRTGGVRYALRTI